MKSKKVIQFRSSKIEIDASLIEIPSSELLTIMEKIWDLQANLHRISATQDSEPAEVITQAQSALIKISMAIVEVIAFRYIQNYQNAIQVWENEGGNFQ